LWNLQPEEKFLPIRTSTAILHLRVFFQLPLSRYRWKTLILNSVEFNETAPSAIVGLDAVSSELAILE
jgi:hypothetical protein